MEWSQRMKIHAPKSQLTTNVVAPIDESPRIAGVLNVWRIFRICQLQPYLLLLVVHDHDRAYAPDDG